MNISKHLECAYIGLMATFLGYAFVNFLVELWVAKCENDIIWDYISLEQQVWINIQLGVQDLCLMASVLCIILFVKSLK